MDVKKSLQSLIQAAVKAQTPVKPETLRRMEKTVEKAQELSTIAASEKARPTP
jgi:hypothetical protein